MEYPQKQSWEVQGAGQWAGAGKHTHTDRQTNLPLPQTRAHTPPDFPDRALSGVRGHGLDLGAPRKMFTQSFIISDYSTRGPRFSQHYPSLPPPPDHRHQQLKNPKINILYWHNCPFKWIYLKSDWHLPLTWMSVFLWYSVVWWIIMDCSFFHNHWNSFVFFIFLKIA